MKKYLSIVFFFSCLCGQAQTKWTLRQCIDYAIENNITVKQQEIIVENSKIDLSTSKNSRLPDLNASLNQSFNFGQSTDYTTNITRMNNTSGARFSVESTMPLFTGLRIPNERKMNELNLKSAIEGLNKIKDNMELQVTSYYLEVLFKKEILKAYQEQAELTSQQVEKTQTLVDAGKVALSQLYDIKAQLAKDELNVTNANNDLILSLLDLAQALNLEDYDGFDITEPSLGDVIAQNQSSILPVSQIYQTAIAVKPHVKEAEYDIESSKKSLKVAQSGYYPKLNFGIGYGTSAQRVYGVNNPDFSTQIKDNGSEYISFSLSIPLFNRFQTRNQVRAARFKIQSNQLALDNVKLNLYKDIQQAYQSAVSAQAKFVSTGKAYDAAAEAYKYAQDRYAVGKSTVYEFSEAQTKLLTSKSEQIQAKYDFLFRAKILDFYRGVEINIE
ncbi:MAG: TolC family protein [Dysgonomonas sp.]